MIGHHAPLAHRAGSVLSSPSRPGGCAESSQRREGRADLSSRRALRSCGRATLERVRLADPFREAGVLDGGVRDADFVLTCSCGTQQRLDAMTVDECGEITLYDCARCTRSVVGVMTEDPDVDRRAPGPLTRRQEAAGHRLRGYVIGSRVDVALRPEGVERDLVLIPATPSFFERYRYL